MTDPAELLVRPAGALVGELTVPGDKSISHRAVMVGALSEERVVVTGFGASADTLATVDAFRRLGVEIERPDSETLVIRGVGGDFEAGANALVPLANGRIEVEETAQVEIALEGGLNVVDANAAGRRVVDHRGGQAGSERVEQVLDGVGSGIFAEQDGRLVRLQRERLRMTELLIGAGKPGSRGAVLTAGVPTVCDLELELRDGRRRFDRLHGRE